MLLRFRCSPMAIFSMRATRSDSIVWLIVNLVRLPLMVFSYDVGHNTS